MFALYRELPKGNRIIVACMLRIGVLVGRGFTRWYSSIGRALDPNRTTKGKDTE